ncbi:SAM-dependent methyltransferase [Leptolyngbya sp. 'hensonii']|uniref:class I SAM-dependent methyltransferase n=1 Tax=Leptolyngbya sp. 'hensonii' TaxID=1922337 RepID=UPI00094F7EA1|nr:class I SAM-dependent methyltransferase [Leptolyngbya sp. 'hensonii']OLP20386.1 SAM-dependent methyltransferase [Leptolyngbya sp. 'hensonii']
MRFEQDHFSGVAAQYARFRPRYPADLFAYLASLISTPTLAWDCATGTGQAAIALAEYFPQVIATDASAEQITHADPHSQVDYRVAPAEQSGLNSGSVDLITVAQALHWFNLPAFYAEAKRVLRPAGVLAIWCYGHLEIPGDILQQIADTFYNETVGPYWPPERRIVEAGYRTLEFPFIEIETPGFAIESLLTLTQLTGYLSTWSATQRYVKATGQNPIPTLTEELEPHWGNPGTPRPIRWPLSLRVGLVP